MRRASLSASSELLVSYTPDSLLANFSEKNLYKMLWMWTKSQCWNINDTNAKRTGCGNCSPGPVVFTRATHSVARSLLWQRVCPSVTAGIVSKRLNLSLNFFDHLVAPSFELFWPVAPIPTTRDRAIVINYYRMSVGSRMRSIPWWHFQ